MCFNNFKYSINFYYLYLLYMQEPSLPNFNLSDYKTNKLITSTDDIIDEIKNTGDIRFVNSSGDTMGDLQTSNLSLYNNGILTFSDGTTMNTSPIIPNISLTVYDNENNFTNNNTFNQNIIVKNNNYQTNLYQSNNNFIMNTLGNIYLKTNLSSNNVILDTNNNISALNNVNCNALLFRNATKLTLSNNNLVIENSGNINLKTNSSNSVVIDTNNNINPKINFSK